MNKDHGMNQGQMNQGHGMNQGQDKADQQQGLNLGPPGGLGPGLEAQNSDQVANLTQGPRQIPVDQVKDRARTQDMERQFDLGKVVNQVPKNQPNLMQSQKQLQQVQDNDIGDADPAPVKKDFK